MAKLWQVKYSDFMRVKYKIIILANKFFPLIEKKNLHIFWGRSHWCGGAETNEK